MAFQHHGTATAKRLFCLSPGPQNCVVHGLHCFALPPGLRVETLINLTIDSIDSIDLQIAGLPTLSGPKHLVEVTELV